MQVICNDNYYAYAKICRNMHKEICINMPKYAQEHMHKKCRCMQKYAAQNMQ